MAITLADAAVDAAVQRYARTQEGFVRIIQHSNKPDEQRLYRLLGGR